jgi:hypothetical protein
VRERGSLPRGLPRGLRFAAGVCLMLSGLTGLFALSEAMNLGRLSELKEARPPSLSLPGNDPVISARTLEAQLSALEDMRESRALVLGALALTCALSFVSAGRLLRPGGLPLGRMRRLLGGATLASAILRTIDGAQMTVVARRAGQAMASAMGSLPELQDPTVAAQVKSLMPSFMAGTMVLQTAFIAGTFALLAQYFRSERIRLLLGDQDDDSAEH